MNKLEYIAKQLARTKKKKYELYVITRIVHQLNRDDIEVVTQQYISRPSPEKHALVDLYFPQLSLCVEVDEPFHEKQIQKDISRETEIIDSTGFSFERIKITDDIHFVNNQVGQLCEKILTNIIKLEKTGQWKPWEVEAKFTIDYHYNIGYLSVQEGSSFRTSVDACNALGQNYKAVQQSWFKLIHYPNHVVWFPKFYENKEWDNAISDDRTTIKMISKDPLKREKYYYKNLYNERKYIMAFPRVIDSLGIRLYKFAGIFVFDEETSSIETGNIFKRVETYFKLIH